MATLFFTSYSGKGFDSAADIPADTRMSVTVRATDILRAADVVYAETPIDGVYAGRWEPSIRISGLTLERALRVGRAACVLFEQESALVFEVSGHSTAPHIMAHIGMYPDDTPESIMALYGASGCSVLPGRIVCLVLDNKAGLWARLTNTIAVGPAFGRGGYLAYGAATFVTASGAS